MQNAASSSDSGRLRWRCRRGVRELDVLLTGFLDSEWAALGPEEQRCFARLLEVQDPEIMDWLLGNEAAPDEAMAGLIEKIRNQPGGRRS